MEDYNSIEARRERAYQWYVRCAYPRYEKMMRHARNGDCMDIEESDFDLLPWKENGQLDREKYREMKKKKPFQVDPPPQELINEQEQQHAGEEHQREADEEHQREQAQQHDDEEESKDVEQQQTDEEKHLEHAQSTPHEEHQLPDEGQQRGQALETALSLTPEEQEELLRRRQNAYDVFKLLANPTRDTMLAALRETEGLDISEDDVDLLPWNDETTKILEHQLGDEIDVKDDLVDTAAHKYPEEDEWDAEMETRAHKAFDGFVKLAKPTRHTFRRIVDETTGLGVHKDDIDLLPWNSDATEVLDLEEERNKREHARQRREDDDLRRRRKAAYLIYKKLANPTAETMHRVLKLTRGLDYSEEDIDLLPWNNDGSKVIEDELGEHGIDVEADLVDLSVPNYPADDEWDEEMEARSQRAFDAFLKLAQPTRHTFRCIVDETNGLGIEKDDIDLLPWNSDATEVLDFEEECMRRQEARKRKEQKGNCCILL